MVRGFEDHRFPGREIDRRHDQWMAAVSQRAITEQVCLRKQFAQRLARVRRPEDAKTRALPEDLATVLVEEVDDAGCRNLVSQGKGEDPADWVPAKRSKCEPAGVRKCASMSASTCAVYSPRYPPPESAKA
jgi:hypothetical protein